MARNPFIPAVAALAVTAGLFSGNNAFGDTGITYRDPLDRPQLARGYRTAIGLKTSQLEGDSLGRGSATTQLLTRFAQANEISQPILYAVERAPSGPGLRSPEQATGVLWRGGERWSSSFESSTSSDTLSESRRTSLLGLIHAPLIGGAGISLGLKYSGAQTPNYSSGNDTPFVNGYAMLSGRVDAPSPQFAYELQLNYLYGERNTVALTYSSRREWEQYRLASDPFTSEGWQLSLTGEHWFSPSWALRYDLPAPESSGVMRRQGLRFGVHYRF